ncbi:hypothetical protein [Streptomyces sp. NBC_00715]|uniref:hypothetical protein n=1 Tax=Streptomyces sp. NBC_00715 TaxID=2975811 RepID=UPI0038657FBE
MLAQLPRPTTGVVQEGTEFGFLTLDQLDMLARRPKVAVRSSWRCAGRPIRGKHLRGWRRRHNRERTKIRSLGERAGVILKSWRLLRKLRCSTTRITAVVRAVVALERAS